MEKFGESVARNCGEPELGQPLGVVGEVDVGGDVLAARVGIDVGSGEPLMQQISTQRAVWPAMIELRKIIAVVDAEHGAAFPMRRPVVQPVANAGVKFAALAVFEGGMTQGTEVRGFQFVRMQRLGHPDFEPAAVLRVPLHERGGKSVEQLVVVDERLTLSLGERGFEIVVPAHFAAKTPLLLCAEHGGVFDDVEGEFATCPPAKGFAHALHERAIARADFDQMVNVRLETRFGFEPGRHSPAQAWRKCR